MLSIFQDQNQVLNFKMKIFSNITGIYYIQNVNNYIIRILFITTTIIYLESENVNDVNDIEVASVF